ncbi:response regulator transcription factor [Kangiella sediminilitoris]|uniref:Response regulator receiver protein n=1 Tax=Kangiella sediminilitoris TaxID=1144748 RepID=A0A1B3B9Q5_9GAMM|nr:response regulator transcription factor [Kangiella sediminilitoris]AOE49530.1 Response regulator receiver protein [Kangiella sediminilitoris]
MKLNDWILIVDDDTELTELLSGFLEKNGFQVKTEANGAKAVKAIVEGQPKLVILDVMLPDLDGLSICREARNNYEGPILMLTALEDDVDEVTGLEIGADDYLAKPVRSRVLLARVRALLRRYDLLAKYQDVPEDESDQYRIKVNGLTIDKVARSATLYDNTLDLTTSEFELLWILAENAGDVVTREAISESFKEMGYDSSTRTIDLRISHLRRKMGDDPKVPKLIKTVRGKGYQLAFH